MGVSFCTMHLQTGTVIHNGTLLLQRIWLRSQSSGITPYLLTLYATNPGWQFKPNFTTMKLEYRLTKLIAIVISVSAHTTNFSGEFYALTCLDTTKILLSLHALTPNQVISLQENLIISGWLDIPDQYALSTPMEANLQDMPLPIFVASWESKMFLLWVKLLNQMKHANAYVTNHDDCVKYLTLSLTTPNTTRCPSPC